MKQNQLERWAYMKPECRIVLTEIETFVCASLTPHASASTEAGWESETSHGGGTIWVGSASEIAPAKGNIFDEDEEE